MFDFSLLRILFGGVLSAFMLLALAGCGSSADSIRVNGLEGVEVSVSESVDGDGVRHAVIEWEEG